MFDVTFDAREIDRWFDGIDKAQRKQAPFALATALTRTAQTVQVYEVQEMRRVFDKPTPFTLKGLRVQPAKKDRLEAAVFFRDFAAKSNATKGGHYLLVQVEGGARRRKRSEDRVKAFLIPGRAAPLDRYGNVKRSELVKMLADSNAFSDTGQNRKAGGKRRYFYVRPGSNKHLRPGLWKRTLKGRGKGRKRGLELMFVARNASPRYVKRFDFDGVAQRVVDRRLLLELDRAWAQALATARP